MKQTGIVSNRFEMIARLKMMLRSNGAALFRCSSASHQAWSSRLKRHSVYTPVARGLTSPRTYLSTPSNRKGTFKCKCESSSLPCEHRPCRRRVITQGETNLSGCFSLITDTLLHCDACWMASSRYYLNFFCGIFSYQCETLVYYVDVQYFFLPYA